MDVGTVLTLSAPGGDYRFGAGPRFQRERLGHPLPLASPWPRASLVHRDVCRDAVDRGLARLAPALTARWKGGIGARSDLGRRTATPKDHAQARLQPALRLQPAGQHLTGGRAHNPDLAGSPQSDLAGECPGIDSVGGCGRRQNLLGSADRWHLGKTPRTAHGRSDPGARIAGSWACPGNGAPELSGAELFRRARLACLRSAPSRSSPSGAWPSVICSAALNPAIAPALPWRVLPAIWASRRLSR
jgi:hypothetical protein